MLIEFSVGNFRSFKEKKTFSMVASADNTNEDTHTIETKGKLRLLRSAVLYGANASGKTNLFFAMNFMRMMVIHSAKDSQASEPIRVHPFQLSTETENELSTFEVVFISDDTRYRFGFQLDKKRIHREWLFEVPTTRESTLYIRENGEIKIGTRFREGKKLAEKTRDNALFLSVAAQFNGEISRKILKWFKNFHIWLDLVERGNFSRVTLRREEEGFKDFVEKLLVIADTGISGVEVESILFNIDDISSKLPPGLFEYIKSSREDGKLERVDIHSLHPRYNGEKKVVGVEKLSMEDDESSGTSVLFELAAPVYFALKNHGVLVIDELTSRLHPLLTRAVLDIFHHGAAGSQAQLIFAGHDTSILTNQLFRRDQVWFAQKDRYGVTDLYSLDEYRIRKDASFNKDYFMGKYGAIPFIGDINRLFPLSKG